MTGLAIEERAVPQSDVPGERLAATQPFPTKPPHLTDRVYGRRAIDFTPDFARRL
ncbi:MAG: hypothetical protein CM1200mP25_2910 [Acidobacteriota bacterium]|nr:MAG: hypothetical protein CM1200mP25_2910 [Acidobacteriota bacterium]